MSLRQSLLTILDLGPSYGYRLHAEFKERTDGTWPLNIGQVYTTLERLERDGRVREIPSPGDGQRYYEITDAGRDEAREWLETPIQPGRNERNELAMKLAIAATLPSVDLRTLIQAQRAATMRQLQDLTKTKAAEDPDGLRELAWSLVIDGHVFHAEADIRWLDHTEERLTRLADAGRPIAAVSADRPAAAPAEPSR